MPYLAADTVKEYRALIRKEFPKWKISVTREHYTTVYVKILEAPINMIAYAERTYHDVTEHNIKNSYANNPEAAEALKKIFAIIQKDQKESFHDSDYGSVPNFYANVRIGEYDKPFKIVQK